MDGKLALTPQQQKLMDEWKELSHKMHEAGIMFVLDDEYANIYVLNGNNIEATANEWEGLSEEELEGFADFNDDNDAQFMDFPNLTVFNENANRLIRRFIPKGINITPISEEYIQKIEDWINNYPRAMFNYKSTNEILSKLCS